MMSMFCCYVLVHFFKLNEFGNDFIYMVFRIFSLCYQFFRDQIIVTCAVHWNHSCVYSVCLLFSISFDQFVT